MKKNKFLFILLPILSASSTICCSKIININDISDLSFVYDVQQNNNEKKLKELILTKIQQKNTDVVESDYKIEGFNNEIFETGGQIIVKVNEHNKLIKGQFIVTIRVSIDNIKINIEEGKTKIEVEKNIQDILENLNKNIKKDFDYSIQGLNDIVLKNDNIIVKSTQKSKYIFGNFKLKITNKLTDISNTKITLIVGIKKQNAEDEIFNVLKNEYKKITKNDYIIQGLNDIVCKNDNIIVKANNNNFGGNINVKLLVSISNIEIIAKVGQKLKDVLENIKTKMNEIEQNAIEGKDYEIIKEGFGSSDDYISDKQKITVRAKKDSEYIIGEFNVLISISIKSIIVSLDSDTNVEYAKQLILNEIKVYQKLINENNWMDNYEIQGLDDSDQLQANQQINVIAKKDSKLLIDSFTINVKGSIRKCKIDVFVGDSKNDVEERIYQLLKSINEKIKKPQNPLNTKNEDYYLSNFEIKLDNEIKVIAPTTSKYISGFFIIKVKAKN